MSNFDPKNFELNFGEPNGDSLKEMVKRMAEFIAYFEIVESRIQEWQSVTNQRIEEHQLIVRAQLLEIRQTVAEFEDLMTEAGVARWRLTAENTLQQGRDHLKLLELVSQQHLEKLADHHLEYEAIAKKSFDRLDRASAYTIKNISDAVSTFRLSDFQQMAEQSVNLIENTATSTIQQLRNSSRRFHIKNALFALGIAAFTSITIGLYLNNEFPWETHQHVVTERHYGATLMSAWPALTEHEREKIIQHSKKTHG